MVQAAYAQTEPPEQWLLKLEDQHLQAMVKRDSAALNSLYDPAFHGVMATGQAVDKTKVVEFLTSGSPHIQISIEDVKSKVAGSLGWTTGKHVSKSKSGSIIGQTRFLRIYHKSGNAWRIIESQGTVIIVE
jgi:hypothetical protein